MIASGRSRKRMRIRDVRELEAKQQEITVRGWVRTKRDSKNVCFFELNDGSCLANLQAVIDKQKNQLDKEIQMMNTGSSVEAGGVLVPSPGKNQKSELQVHSLSVIGQAETDYPLQKKRHSFEFLREIAHLRPRTNTFGAVTRIRNAVSTAVHAFFQERGFLWIHTPIITGSDAEGAGEMFRVTTRPAGTGAEEDEDQKDFFGKNTFLTVSGQLNVESYACSMERVYTFGPTFRAENSNTSRHLAEFWMIEPEMAFCDINCNMDLAVDFLKYIFSRILEECREDMEFFNLRIQPGLIDSLRGVVESEFTRISYTEAVDRLMKSGTPFEYPAEWGRDLQSEHEKYLTEEVYHGPVIVSDYPKEIKAFYMKQNEDGNTVRAMDVLVPRLGEIIGGSQREDDYAALTRRIRELGLEESNYWWYLDLRRYGTVPHSGFGLGFERLIQYITGMQNIRDVIPFPRSVGSAEF